MGFRSYIYSGIFGLHYHPILIYAYGLIVFSFKASFVIKLSDTTSNATEGISNIFVNVKTT